MDWEERLTGLGLIALGLLGLLLVTWVARGGPLLTPPPGLTAFNPVQCLSPFIAVGSFGVILVGLKKLLLP